MASQTSRWYLRPLTRWGVLRDVPLRRLWVLLLAVFLLFSIIGYYTDLLNDGNTPYSIVFLMGIYSGLNACLWVYGTARWPAPWILALGALQFFNGKILSLVSRWLIARFQLPFVASRQGNHFAATAIIVSAIASYSLFLRFIVTESKRSIRLENELDLAQNIQRTLVPTLHLHTAHFEIYGVSHPSEQVGGDLVDAVPLATGDTLAYLADIAGHGLPASILMGRLKTATRTAVLECAGQPPLQMLSSLLSRLNTVFPQVKEPHLYATFTGFRLGAEGTVVYALAASPPVFFWSTLTRAVIQLDEPQLPLGLLPVPHFDSVALQTRPGDVLVVATDGILEVTSQDGEEWGADRLKQLLAGHAQAPLPALADLVVSTARGFGRQFDDQTLLLIRRRETSPG